ncbi:hypothetical protein [Nocardia sp. NPDC055049]
MMLIGRDGSVWHITAGPSGHTGERLGRRRRIPDWLDALLVRAGQWLADRAGLGHR